MKILTSSWSLTPLLEDTLWQILSDEMAKDLDNWPKNESTGNLPYGWAGELTYPNRTDFDDHMAMYKDMVRHINTVVKNPNNNALWTKIGDCIYVQFRKQKDMDWFILKYGA